MIGEIPQRFKGTVEDFYSHAEHLSNYKTDYGPFRMSYPREIQGVSIQFSIGENGWAKAQRLPDGGCVITVGVEGEDEVMWQRLYAYLDGHGFWEKEQGEQQPTSDTADTIARLNIVGQPMYSFARGKWASDFETLEASLEAFAKRTLLTPFGEYSFRFSILPNPAFKEPRQQCWMIGQHDYNQETLHTGTPDAPNAEFEGWPYAEVMAREIPSGLAVEILHNGKYTNAMVSYLHRLEIALTDDGWEKTKENWIMPPSEPVTITSTATSHQVANTTVTLPTQPKNANNDELTYDEQKILKAYNALLEDGLHPSDEAIAARLPLGRKGKPYSRETVNRKRQEMRKKGIQV